MRDETADCPPRGNGGFGAVYGLRGLALPELIVDALVTLKHSSDSKSDVPGSPFVPIDAKAEIGHSLRMQIAVKILN